MTQPAEHVEFEVLNDYVDGRLDLQTVRRVDEHVADCQQCSDELLELRTLLDGVASLPRSVLPDDGLWNDLKGSIERSKEIVLPIQRAGASELPVEPRNHTFDRKRRGTLAAAAVLLIVASSWVTATIIRSTGSQAAYADANSQEVTKGASGAPVLPASFRVAEGKYVSTIEELRAVFDTQRGQLTPATVETVDRSLAVIDSAIAEARAALLTDPGNRTLVDLLSASYQRKLDLLRRTSELTPRT